MNENTTPTVRVTFPEGYRYTTLARDDLDRARIARCISLEQRRIALLIEQRRKQHGETVQARTRAGRLVRANTRTPGPYVRWTFTPDHAGGGRWRGELVDRDQNADT